MSGSIATLLKSLTADMNAYSQADKPYIATVLPPLFFHTGNLNDKRSVNRKKCVDKCFFILFLCGLRSFLFFRFR